MTVAPSRKIIKHNLREHFLRTERQASQLKRRPYRLAIAPTMEWKIFIPSMPPSAGSEDRSGWGIMPTTLPPALQMPAILSSEPFGLADDRNLTRRRRIAKHYAVVTMQFIQGCLVTEVVPFHVADGDGQHFALRSRHW